MSSSAPALRSGATEPSRRLFCLPFAGGGPAAYRLWHQSLPPGVQVVAFELPGRQPNDRAPLLDDVDDIVASILPTVSADDTIPYAIFGHSMGALIAFELTLAIEALDCRRPDMLFVSGRRSPDERGTGTRLQDLDDAAFVEHIQAEFGGIPEAVLREPDLMALLLPRLRADVRAFENYRHRDGTAVRSPLAAYGGSSDPHARPHHLEGWRRVASGGLVTRIFPGDHFYLTDQRDALMADIANRWIDRELVA